MNKNVLIAKNQFKGAKLEHALDAAGHYGFDKGLIKKLFKDGGEQTFENAGGHIRFFVKVADGNLVEAEIYK